MKRDIERLWPPALGTVPRPRQMADISRVVVSFHREHARRVKTGRPCQEFVLNLS